MKGKRKKRTGRHGEEVLMFLCLKKRHIVFGLAVIPVSLLNYFNEEGSCNRHIVGCVSIVWWTHVNNNEWTCLFQVLVVGVGHKPGGERQREDGRGRESLL